MNPNPIRDREPRGGVRAWPFLVLALTLAGCGGGKDGGGGSSYPKLAATASKPRIALLMKSLANEFFATMAEGARRHQAGHAEVYDLIINGTKDERDLSRQVALVDEMIAQGVDAIVITPADSKALVSACKRARDAGIVVVNIDNKLDDQVLADQGIKVPFVGPDNRAGVRRVGEFLARRLKPGDPVGMLEGIRTTFNGQQRRLGFEDAMKSAGVTIIDSQTAQWEMEPANRIAAAMLGEHPQIKALLCCNDNMALGALAAVKAAGRVGEVWIVGFDNIAAIQSAIKDGSVLATADQHGDQIAVYGIELALKMLRGESPPADTTTPVDLITAESLRSK
ncbi:MAG TPA: sugar ABC transporter substrate-binding protein [Isosphaeraceae bacterium]|nr:sugar ABC transporter substrate-binding protein [Isosphaeraceae bacterium]